MIKLTRIPHNRVIIFFTLFLILIGLCIYYNDNITAKQSYPTTGAVVKYYPEGQMVSVSGTVTGTFNNGFYIQDYYRDKSVTFRVYSDIKVSPGYKIGVIGVLGPDYQIKTQSITVTEKWSYQFVLLRSFLALLFLVFIFHRYWRFDLKTYEFVRRR
jgi:hypothetical protein